MVLRATLTPPHESDTGLLPPNASGRFGLVVRLHSGHSYRLLASYLGASGYRPSSSGYRLLALRRR